MDFAFQTQTPNIVVEYMKSYTKIKSPDCSFYTEDGNEIPFHKELLYQTKLMEKLIKSLDCYCSKIEIILPSVSIEELDLMVEFLYCGQISCTNPNLASRVSSNLQELLGFSTSLYISRVILNPYLEKRKMSTEPNIQFFSNETICEEEAVDLMTTDNSRDFLSKNELLELKTKEVLESSCNSTEGKDIGSFFAVCDYCCKIFTNRDNLIKHKSLRCEKSVESVQDEAESSISEEFSIDLLSNYEKGTDNLNTTSELDLEWELDDEQDIATQGFYIY